MRDWATLQVNVSRLQTQYTLWSSDLPEVLKGQWVNHGVLVFQHLTKLLALENIGDEEKENRLRRYFALRWQLTQRTSVDYTLHSQYPANRACLLVAEAIARADESVLQILMPTVTAVIGVADTTMGIKEASENSEGKFIPSCFLINTKADAVIALQDLFEYTKEDTNRLFSDEPLFSLSAEDQKNIFFISPEAGRYYTALAAIHRIKNNEKMSAGYLLRYLQKTLLKASRSRSGSELQADFSECAEPILSVYHWWRRLQENYRPIYRKISQYHSAHSTEILENYLLALFSSISGPELNADEIQIVVSLKKNISFYCAEQMANGLEAIISHNTDLEKIPLPGYEKSFDVGESIPDAEELIALHTAFVDALSRRYPMVGCDGELAHRFSFFEAFALKLTQEKFSVRDYFQVVPSLIGDLEFLDKLYRILWMLPQESWCDFFAFNNRKFTRLLCAYSYPFDMLLGWILKTPPANWRVFFEAISSVGVLRTHFNAISVSFFFENCPEARWKTLHKAMLPLLSTIFQGSEDLVSFFRSLQSSAHFKDIAALFSNELKNCFSVERPESLLIDLFLSFEKEMWYMLASALRSIFFEKITTFRQILFMVGRIEDLSHRVDFLKYAMRYATAFSVEPVTLFSFLQMVDEKEWQRIFQLIGEKRLNTFIVDHVTLLAFLRMFSNPESRFLCARAIQPNIFLNQEINSAQLFLTLNKFPECNDAFVMIYRHQLVRVLDELLTTLSTLNQNGLELPAGLKKVFCFLVEKTLPTILDYGYFFSHFPRVGSGELTNAQTQLMIDFKEIQKKYTLLDVSRKKAEVLEIFCRENPSDVFFHPGLTLKFFQGLLQQWPLLASNKSEKIMRDQGVQVGEHPVMSVVAPSLRRSRVWSDDALRARIAGGTSQASVDRSGTNAYRLFHQDVEIARQTVRRNPDPVSPARTEQRQSLIFPVTLFSLRPNPSTGDGESPSARRLR